MIHSVNMTPHAFEEFLVNGAVGHARVVVVRVVTQGSTGRTLSPAAGEAGAICKADRFAPDGELLEAGDLVLDRPGTSVTVRGAITCSAPETAQLEVGGLRWTGVALAPRRWVADHGEVRIEQTGAFQPVVPNFRAAFGGPDFEPNPIGRGFVREPRDSSGVELPLVEDPHALITSPADHPAPHALALVAPGWPQRRLRAGTYDEAWKRTRAPYTPADLDARFHDPGTLVSYPKLRGGETVRLVNLGVPGETRWTLPRSLVRLSVENRVVGLGLDHVMLDPARDEVTSVLRAVIPVQGRMATLPVVLIRELRRVRRSAEEATS